MKFNFFKFGGEEITDYVQYVVDFLKEDPYSIAVVGTDSKQTKYQTMYATCIALYNPFLHRGAHVIFCRFKIDKVRDMFSKLYKEAEFSLQLAEELQHRLSLEGYTRKDLKKDETHLKLVDIHVDYNPDPGKNGHNKSHVVYNAVMPWIKGQDYRVFAKPNSFVATSCADLLMKKRKPKKNRSNKKAFF